MEEVSAIICKGMKELGYSVKDIEDMRLIVNNQKEEELDLIIINKKGVTIKFIEEKEEILFKPTSRVKTGFYGVKELRTNFNRDKIVLDDMGHCKIIIRKTKIETYEDIEELFLKLEKTEQYQRLSEYKQHLLMDLVTNNLRNKTKHEILKKEKAEMDSLNFLFSIILIIISFIGFAIYSLTIQ